MSKFVTADTHFGETRMQILGRPFTSRDDMIKKLVSLYNSVVGKNDEVFIVGDVCYKDKSLLHIVKKLNGHKTLIRGNHDSIFTDDELLGVFDDVIKDGGGINLKIDGIPCYITHYPTRGKQNRFNLVGHIHSAWKYQLNMFNIGIDCNCFLPVNLNTIPFHLEAISKFYDDDVWVAYNEINKKYFGERGKDGSYFKEEENG